MKTWATMKAEIQRECNVEGEDFVSEQELLDWANDAKDEAEAEIVSLYDRYLETSTTLTTTSGSGVVSLPTDIYANKITGLWFDDGSEIYEIKQVKRKEEIHFAGDNDKYKFYITNSTASGTKIQPVPAARESSSSNLTCYYIRESAAIDADSDYMDIPIAEGFIKQYVKDKIQEKELGPMAPKGRSDLLEKQRSLMIEALNQMIPDDSSDELQPDLSAYTEFIDEEWGY